MPVGILVWYESMPAASKRSKPLHMPLNSAKAQGENPNPTVKSSINTRLLSTTRNNQSRRAQRSQRNPQLLHRCIDILKIQRRNGPLSMLLRLQHALIVAIVLAR